LRLKHAEKEQLSYLAITSDDVGEGQPLALQNALQAAVQVLWIGNGNPGQNWNKKT
jgi:hypothetical protein